MELDRFEYLMLDVVLEAFGSQDSLTREHLLEIFDQDEPMAAAIVSKLVADDLVAEIGISEQDYLPVFVIKKQKVYPFLQSGGYAAQEGGQTDALKTAPVQNHVPEVNNKTAAPERKNESAELALNELQQQNRTLLQENMRYREIIDERNSYIRVLHFKIKQLEYLKIYWWFIGLLLAVIIVLSYHLLAKHH